MMRKLVRIFKALSDPNRVRILKMLQVRPLCVCEITEILRLSNSTVSKHLFLLREADLIVGEKEGKWVNYRLNLPAEDEYGREILRLLAEWLQDDEQIKRDLERVRNIDRYNLVCRT